MAKKSRNKNRDQHQNQKPNDASSPGSDSTESRDETNEESSSGTELSNLLAQNQDLSLQFTLVDAGLRSAYGDSALGIRRFRPLAMHYPFEVFNLP